MNASTGTATAPCMQFRPSEDEEAVVEAAAALFDELSDDESVVAHEKSGAAYDETLWRQVTASGLIEAVLPESAGGADLGMTGLALILREQGMRLGRVPLATTGVAALAIAHLGGSAATAARIADGTARVAALLPEELDRVTGRADADGYLLDGAIAFGYLVPAATDLLVVFRTADGERAAIIPVDRSGIDVDAWWGLSKQSHAAVTFTNVQVAAAEVLGAGGDAATWVRRRLLVAAAALQAGVTAEAVRRTAAYVSEREQFGRPLSTNQGVTLRAADASIDAEAIALTALDAAFQLDDDADGAEAAETALVSSWWAKEAGFRVVHATQHLHGGMGADVDNHIHRFFVWAREIDVLWGQAASLRDELGSLVAEAADGVTP